MAEMPWNQVCMLEGTPEWISSLSKRDLNVRSRKLFHIRRVTEEDLRMMPEKIQLYDVTPKVEVEVEMFDTTTEEIDLHDVAVEVFNPATEAIKYVNFEDAALLVATDVLHTLLNRLNFFFDEEYLNTVEVANVDFKPFQNGGESLTYWNVAHEYDELMKEVAETEDDELMKDVAETREWNAYKRVVKHRAQDLPELWFLNALSHAEGKYVEDLVNNHGFVVLEGESIRTIQVKLRDELLTYVTGDFYFRFKKNEVAHPFGIVLRNTVKAPLTFSWYSSKQRVTGSYSRPLTQQKRRELLAMLNHFSAEENIPPGLEQFSTAFGLQIFFLKSLIRDAPLKSTEVRAPPETGEGGGSDVGQGGKGTQGRKSVLTSARATAVSWEREGR